MLKLVEKINLVMGELGAVPKNGKNSFQNYSYMAHADLMAKIHPLLIKHGLAILPKSMRVISCTSETFKIGAKETHQNRVAIEVTYNITDGESTLEFSGVGEGVDSQDKSSYKAQTGAQKYALKQLFHIPDELDAEADGTGGSSIHDPEQSPENNAYKVGQTMQKAGIERANQIKEYHEANLLKDKEIKDALTKHKAASVKELPKNVADDLINLALDRETVLNDAKGK